AFPLTIALLPAQLRIRSVQDLLKNLDAQKETIEVAQRDARYAMQRFAARLALLAFLGGALGSLVVGRRRGLQIAGSGGLCLLLAAASLGWVAHTFSVKGFDSPRYTGILSEAPTAIDMVRRGFSDLGRVRSQLKNTA